MHRLTRIATIALLVSAPSIAAAQQLPAAPKPPAGPSRLVVQPIESGLLVSPDARFTDVDGKFATLAGGYAGWLTDQTWFVGGGGYWLANNEDDFEMYYLGAIVEYFARGHETVGFGARALVGGGSATLSSSFDDLFGPRTDPVAFGMPQWASAHRGGRGPHFPPGRIPPNTTRVLVSDEFFVVEPQVSGHWRITRWLRVNAGVGYRLTAGTDWLDDRLNGASGSIGLQFGGS